MSRKIAVCCVLSLLTVLLLSNSTSASGETAQGNTESYEMFLNRIMDDLHVKEQLVSIFENSDQYKSEESGKLDEDKLIQALNGVFSLSGDIGNINGSNDFDANRKKLYEGLCFFLEQQMYQKDGNFSSMLRLYQSNLELAVASAKADWETQNTDELQKQQPKQDDQETVLAQDTKK